MALPLTLDDPMASPATKPQEPTSEGKKKPVAQKTAKPPAAQTKETSAKKTEIPEGKDAFTATDKRESARTHSEEHTKNENKLSEGQVTRTVRFYPEAYEPYGKFAAQMKEDRGFRRASQTRLINAVLLGLGARPESLDDACALDDALTDLERSQR